jgi:hypothetical protein
MNKIVLSIAGVMAAVAFAPEASAVPAFARQVGMGCSACHFNSYPILTGFGKAFKTSGYTMMGAQEKIEGEHLSIPATLNMAIYMQSRYIKTNGVNPAGVGGAIVANTNQGRIDVPDEFAMFVGGRATENIGALIEINIASAAAGLAGVKLPIMFDVGSMKVGAVPYTNGGLGPQFAYDVFATGSTANGRVMENGGGYSAAMNLGTNLASSGLGLVAANETFHAVYVPYAPAQGGSATATKLGGNYIRLGYTPTIADWELGIGVQSYSGDPMKGVNGAIPGTVKGDATIIDFQGQGELAGMPVGVYGSYGFAAGSGYAVGAPVNLYNSSFMGGVAANPERRSYFGLMADVGVIPHSLNVQVGFSRGKTGSNVGAVVGTNETDNSYTIGLRYKLAQNAKVAFAYTKSSGSAYNVGGTAPNATRNFGGLANAVGDSLTTLILSTGF